MSTSELSDLMHDGVAVQRPTSPDLDGIRRRGSRIRRRRHLSIAGGVAAAVVLLGGAVGLAVDLRGSNGRGADTLGEPREATGLTAYERRALSEVPGSYAVDGTVILPSAPGAYEMGGSIDDNQVVSDPLPLGFHAYAGGALNNVELPEFLQGNPPKGSQVLGDQGAAYLGCVRWEADNCVPSVLGRDSGGHFHLDYGLGTDKFLTDGSEMEVFTGSDYSQKVYRATVLGGLPGTEATRVEIISVDGQAVEASLDRGQLRAGDTLFWATLPEEAARVVAYDDNGDVVADHKVRPCGDPVDCEVR